MSAEDLDKLFRDKLQNKPVAPSAEAWERLQARMQPQPEQEERKPVMMWYSMAVAAAVALLLSVGLWINQKELDLGQPSETMATTQAPSNGPAVLEKPVTEIAPLPTQRTPTEGNQEVPVSPSQETTPQRIASVQEKTSTSEDKVSQPLPNKPVKEGKKAKAISEGESPAPSMLANNAPVKRSEVSTTTSDAEPLEIIVKLSDNQATTSAALASNTVADTPDEDEQRSAGRVVKNIFKQVKNLRDGEKIDREALGIPKHTFAFETRIGNKTISKSIQL